MDQPSPESTMRRALRYLRRHRMKEAARLLPQCDLKLDPVSDAAGELTGWNVWLRCEDEIFHELKDWDGGARRWRHKPPMEHLDRALKAVVKNAQNVDAEWVDGKEVTWKIRVGRKRIPKRGPRASNASGQQAPTVDPPTAVNPSPGGQTDPVKGSEAALLFGLIKALEGKGGKPPSVLTVFQLYCVENLSAEEVRRRCKCGKGTVVKRLNKLREVTGKDPRALRAMSAQFERIERELSDSRARRIRRESALDQPEDDEQNQN